MIAALVLALGATGVAAQTPPAGGEGASGPGASPPPPPTSPTPTPAPAAPPAATPAAPSATPPAPAAGAQPQQGTPATVLDTSDYESLLGRSVRSAQGDELGRVIDVIIDKEGHPRAAIIDFGGFLGVGTRKIAVDWRALRFASDGKERRLSVALTRNQVRVSPEYKSGEPIVVLGPASGTPPEGEQAGVAPAGPPAPVVPPASMPPSAPAAAPVATPAAPPAAPAPEKAPDK
ncbi:PRC-barrel domain-containing protein [Methylobacterium sp. J-067]|nr:PRC-barrel domain-containing protein [Methylobacterium sp. J-067]MCJ2027473.1 PRC-barrel domain-containing protein [Methylobacterium sp. J-067]